MGKLKSLLVKLYSIGVIKKSSFFDKEWYINEYSDLGGIYRVFPALHYAFFGYREGRNPSKSFNTDYYLNAYDDVKNSGLNPLYHYERIGKKENRKMNGLIHLYNILSSSSYFDNDWYIRNYMLYSATSAPWVDYLSSRMKNPSPIFYSNEYLYLNPDVAIHSINPLVHYINYGRYENRLPALTELKEYNAPTGTSNLEKDFFTRKSYNKHIVTVFACFSASGRIVDYQLYLLKGLQKISDYIVIVSDNPVYEEELTKIDEICNHCIFIRHGEYDFGSYKCGYNFLIKNKILHDEDNLLFINDSNYGPVYPFENVIDDFKSKQCDFYGLSVGRTLDKEFVQSFFYIFKHNVYNSECFKQIIKNIKKEISAPWVIVNYEYNLTDKLSSNGYKYSSFVLDFMNDKKSIVPTKYGYTLMNDYKYPLVKRKAIQGSTVDSVDDILGYISETNKELYDIIIKHERIEDYKREKHIDLPSKYLLLSNYAKKEQEIREKVKHGEKINVIFLAYSDETFIAHRVMRKMMDDSTYCVKLYFIPDLRHGHHMAALTYMEKFKLFKEKYPNAEQVIDNVIDKYVEAKYNDKDKFFSMLENTKRELVIENEKEYIKEKCFDGFRNVIKDGDVVFYPHVQDISFSLYNPYYAVRLNKLSVYIPHEIYLYKYDRNYYRMDNFNNFWKVFLDSQISYYEYKQYGQCQAINAEIIGLDSNYYKCNDERKDNKRTKIVIAPYFSIHNGRKMLNSYVLENYGKELFQLPVKYPNIDFIYMFSDALNNMLLNTENKEIKEIDIYKNNLKDYSNALVCGEQDYKNILLSSSAVILDSGTLFTDAVILNIPCLYIVKDIEQEKKKFNEIGYYMYDAIYKAEERKDIYGFMDNIINNYDTYKDKRNNVLNDISLEYKNIDEEILEYFKKYFQD